MNARQAPAADMPSIDTKKMFPATRCGREPLRKDIETAPENTPYPAANMKK